MKTSIKTFRCVKTVYNRNMGIECWSDESTIFYIDKNNWIEAGDEIKFEIDEGGFYRSIWVNGKLMNLSKLNEMITLNLYGVAWAL